MPNPICIVEIGDDGLMVSIKPLEKLRKELKKGKYEVTFKHISKRSSQANRYYWHMLTYYVQPGLYNAGWSDIKTKEDAHIFVGKLFLTVKMVNENTGEIMERVRSTTDLSKMEMNAYWEEIWQWSAQYLGVVIPEPNSQFTLY